MERHALVPLEKRGSPMGVDPLHVVKNPDTPGPRDRSPIREFSEDVYWNQRVVWHAVIRADRHKPCSIIGIVQVSLRDRALLQKGAPTLGGMVIGAEAGAPAWRSWRGQVLAVLQVSPPFQGQVFS